MRYPSSLISVVTRPADNRGFALIIALSLMGFIFLLLLSLGTLTRVSIESASQSELQSRAQQNAMAGLYVALGELQRYAGPDQRATATANIASTQNELPMPVAGTGNWMGVWGNANNPQQQGAQRAPRLLNWLVSGNEGLVLAASTTDTSFGQVTAPAGGNWRPTVSPNEATPVGGSASATDNFRIGARDARLLVGPKTAGTGAGAADRYVIAPLVPIDSNTGAASSGVPMENRYAYWIGDEGVKARINLVNPWPVAGGSAATMRRERNYSFGSAQRVAADKIAGFNNLPSTALPANSMVGDVVEMQQVGMIEGVNNADVAERFHDVTVHSRSVLADARQGGLKRDLTSILRTGGGSGDEANDRFIFPDENDSFTSGDPFYKKPPTWGLLRDFARFETNPAGLAIRVQTPTAMRQGLSPVLIMGGMYYSWDAVFKEKEDETTGAKSDVLMLCIYVSPRVLLWNPYNRAINSENYEIGFLPPRSGDKGIANFTFTKTENLGTEESPNWVQTKNEAYAANIGARQFDTLGATRDMLRFTARSGSLEPGEVVGLSLPPNGEGEPLSYVDGSTTLERVRLQTGSNYIGVARVLIAEIEIDEKAAPSIEDKTRRNIDVETLLLNLGEGSMYLAEPGAGSSSNAESIAQTASSPSNNNRFYQWVGRVGITHNERDTANNNQIPDGKVVGTFAIPLDGTNEGLVNYEIYHKLGIGSQYMPSLPVRWIAAGNPRAYMQGRTGMEVIPNGQPVNPMYTGFAGSFSMASHSVPLGNAVNRSTNGEATIGNDYNNSSFDPDIFPRPMLFELPSNESPLMSIADLRHAALQGHGTSPSYAVGNSIADYRVGRTRKNRNIAAGGADPSGIDPTGDSMAVFDHSYELNDALWDKYFFSTLPAGTGSLPETLPNSRHAVLSRDGSKPRLVDINGLSGEDAAANMLLEGGFNVNSTSVEAWKAVLGGLDGLRYDPKNPSSNNANPLRNPFSRFRQTRTGAGSARPEAWASGTNTRVRNMIDYFSGYRELDAEQIDGLAERLVEQVRNRGPFLSLADFVNRALDTDAPDEHQLKGAIQAAIDNEAGGLNQKGGDADINFVQENRNADGGGRHLISYSTAENTYGYPSGWSSSYDTQAYIGWNGAARNSRNNPFTRNAAFAPGEVTQSDVLAAVGASLTVRSDTFIIRSYGEVIDPVTNQVKGRAWCEAVVQRMPDYVNSFNDAKDSISDLSPENVQFGRRFVVTAFRWLNAEDI